MRDQATSTAGATTTTAEVYFNGNKLKADSFNVAPEQSSSGHFVKADNRVDITQVNKELDCFFVKTADNAQVELYTPNHTSVLTTGSAIVGTQMIVNHALNMREKSRD